MTGDLGKLFDAHSEWLAADTENLTAKSASAETVFLKKLAVPELRSKLTLSDI